MVCRTEHIKVCFVNVSARPIKFYDQFNNINRFFLSTIKPKALEDVRRDLQSAVFQLEHRTSDQVRLAIAERRPEKAYRSPSYRMHGLPDHSYAVAVTDQATRIREVTERGRGLEETLDVAELEFGRHVQEALNLRKSRRMASQIARQLGNRKGPGDYHAPRRCQPNRQRSGTTKANEHPPGDCPCRPGAHDAASPTALTMDHCHQ